MKTIKLFNEGIYKKATAARNVRLNHHNVVNELSQLDAKINYYRKEKDFAEVSKLKKRQNELEGQIGAIEEELQDEGKTITDKDFQAFYDTYNGELNTLNSKHSKLNEQMLEKIEELKVIFAELDENKHVASRLISRKRYVDALKNSPDSTTIILEDSMPTHKVVLCGTETDPREYSWIVDNELSAAVKENAQKHYNNGGIK
ncbi:hypothetical protein [Mammaliicoccus fleurettii]|uniref:hypothetical protein n=1 Tax=Mammaliicoccus fleurettii TaxID=150056 RepID=UPI002DB730B0|nr:hypothetical protein [Mammaliicoccus fleurettii]MEB8067698.1 hypothetical protein [Mammaliicoccus fleurettii]